MNTINQNLIKTVEQELNKAGAKETDRWLEQLWKHQPYLLSLTEAMLEVFEDDEDFLEECHYYWLFIDKVFHRLRGSIPVIGAGHIEKVLHEIEPLWQEMEERQDAGAYLAELIEQNPQSELLLYFYDEVTERAEEADDITLTNLLQLMMYIFEITAVYQSINQQL